MVRQIPVCTFFLTVVLGVARAKWEYPPFTQYIKGVPRHNLNLSITCIMRPANHATAIKRSAPQALGYRCAHCSSEFDSRTGMDCHRRHPTSLGTPCADPHNSKSLSFTARANVASSFLRQHDTLGTTGIPAHCTHTLHVYIVPLCVMMCDITCIIVITAIIAKISAIIGNKVSSFLWEDTNYTYYYRLLYALSQRFCMKNNRK